MAIAQHLEDFSKRKSISSDASSGSNLEELEDQKLASFEEGYSAGWEDAVQAQQKRSGFLSDTVAKCVENFSVSLRDVQEKHQEACISLNYNLISKLLALPPGSHLPRIVAEKVAGLTANSDIVSLEVRTSGDQKNSIEHALCGIDRVTVSSDPSLASGTAQISVKRNEFEMNIEQVAQEISEILDSCLSEARGEA